MSLSALHIWILIILTILLGYNAMSNLNINFQVALRSELCLGHSYTILVLKHSSVTLAVCLGLLSCWKVNLCPSLFETGKGFSSCIALYFSPSSFPVPADEKCSEGNECCWVSTKIAAESSVLFLKFYLFIYVYIYFESLCYGCHVNSLSRMSCGSF